MDSIIEFHSLVEDFKIDYKEDIQVWINHIATRKGFIVSEVNFIFCTDDYLLKKNRESLNHDYFTDILTFSLSPENSNLLIGDIFISLDRVKSNSLTYNQSFIDELHRVIIHGVLHLCGINDKTEEEQLVMKNEEDISLSLRMF